MKSRSRFIDEEAARLAVSLARPAIEAALRDAAVSGQHVLHLVVLDPASPPGACRFEEALLYEQTLGRQDRTTWDADYATYARDKAALSWRHGMDSRRLQLLEPHRLGAEDHLVWGGVCLDGIVVAASGAMPQWDETFSFWVAGALRAIAYERALSQAT
ncbi:MAG: hypothetical protein GTN84_11615 [Hydrogenophaga sp.]|uniref:hypothetical protein n=1 Tax=Hydrogenophaga sp. TaxID=1904254 RepID=UPI0016A62125|nr:hypothetical protein [Hydrogenophaga sp.]NIM41733.1 hypothetical protein [Hydrogenophaga sp.]NIN27038.1 hypothetical protein [Hydrogenophaga sp.]NIN31739.1 hypothetical protein [Hydrogenophaga sp.]NIN55983.1 hypothetical protein [Hydrogenophaga sp.]NIO52110.1 hypothetical protein [Hydrogenophaga sp.]